MRELLVVFDTGTRYKNTSLNENLQKGPDLRIMLYVVWILLCLRKGRCCVMADIEKKFHQVLVRDQDRGALRFVWCTSKKEQLRDIQMNVDSFGKVGSPCCYLWALKKTATDSITNIIARAKEAITEKFCMDDYLDSFNTQSEAMEIS